jgi:hypothetical protein
MKSDSHETWKCVDPELEWQIRCFPYGKRSDVPRLHGQQVEQKAVVDIAYILGYNEWGKINLVEIRITKNFFIIVISTRLRQDHPSA